jgi:hypothetical protein
MAGGESVNAWLIVIHKIGKTLNLCIIKTPESPVPADHPLKTRLFRHAQKPPKAARPGDHFLRKIGI